MLGIGYGVYLSVDFALCTEVLPEAEARGKDLGIINVANALPQVFAAVRLGAVLVAGRRLRGALRLRRGGCLLGSVLVVNIRSVA